MNPHVPSPVPAVDDWMQAVPTDLQECVSELRSLIYQVAREEDAWPLVEEVKWGQPSYRSPNGNESTPLRLGWTEAGDAALLAHCQSSVVPEFRDAFGDRFRYEGNRAVLFNSTEEIQEAELAAFIRHALTYRR